MYLSTLWKIPLILVNAICTEICITPPNPPAVLGGFIAPTVEGGLMAALARRAVFSIAAGAWAALARRVVILAPLSAGALPLGSGMFMVSAT